MSGTGGGYFSHRLTPGDLVKRTRQAEDEARDDAFETTVNEYLASILSEFNDRDVEGTQEVLENVKALLDSEIEGTVDTLFGGSVAKNTYLEGISDVDALVLLDNTELADEEPNEVKSFLATRLISKYGKAHIQEGNLAVTVTVNGKTIQLLPALRSRGGVRIASSDGTRWSRVNPQAFAKALTETNLALGGKVVPCIKLIKAIVSTLPEKRQITGYHAESMAIKVFRGYTGPRTTKGMLRHFFDRAAQVIKEPIRDASGQSVHVDEYLDGANSLKRRIVADAFDGIGRRIRNADGAISTDRWRELFG